jgi:hypothetical protein
VVAVGTILAAVAIPYGLNYIRIYQTQAAAQGVASTMQMSRAQAVKRNTRIGLILSFDYPQPGQFQFTVLDENPDTLGNDAVYPGTGGSAVFDPDVTDWGLVPAPPNNMTPPHGPIASLPVEVEFDPTAGGAPRFSSLLFRANGAVEAVNPSGFPGGTGTPVVYQDGVDWVVTIRHPRYGFVRDIRISRNGRVQVIVQN